MSVNSEKDAQKDNLLTKSTQLSFREQIQANARPATTIAVGVVFGAVLVLLGFLLANVPDILRLVGTMMLILVPVVGIIYLFGFGVWQENVRSVSEKVTSQQ